MTNVRVIVWLLVGILALAAANVLLSLDGNEAQKPALVSPAGLVEAAGAEVSMIGIARGGEAETVLTRTGSWRLVEPFSASVDESVVLKLLDALEYGPVTDMLGDKDLLKLGRRRADFGLDDPRLRIRVRAGEAETVVSFGSPTPSSSGVYAAIGGVAAVFVVPTNTLASVDVPASAFRRRKLFLSGEESVSSFDVRRGSELLGFRREGDGWQMTQPTPGPASVQKIRKLLSDVMGASAVDFVWPVGASNEVHETSAALLAGYGLDAENAVTVTLRELDGAEGRVSFGAEAKDGLVYALVHNGATIVTVDRALKDEASLGNTAFADTRLFPYEPSQVTGLSLVDGDVSCLLAKGKDGAWRMDAPISAQADAAAVSSLLTAVLALRGADADEGGVEVSVAAGDQKVRVSRQSLGANFSLENLRSREILRVDPASVRRVAVTGADTNLAASVVYDRDRRAWNVESSARPGTVSERGVARVLGAVAPLEAVRIVKLKVSADDLSVYGLDAPRLTVAIDLAREDAIRRNILVGDRADAGWFATVGASDAVFVLPMSAVEDLSANLVGEE